jgi:D-hexose-6-phosphate mutarotase
MQSCKLVVIQRGSNPVQHAILLINFIHQTWRMLQLTKKQQEVSLNNILQEAFTPAGSGSEIDKTFAHDLKVILRAMKYIDNPATQQKILEFYLSALIANYAEIKISYLIETNLNKSLNQGIHYGRESKRSGS